MGLKETFQKQGGIRLLKQYWKGGAFFTAVNQFLVLGRSRTALEILRLSASLKVKKKLQKRYLGKLNEFDKNWTEKEHKASDKVWVCWFQGMENAPALVQQCYHSLKVNLPDKDITLITSENMGEYVQFPEDIQRKIDAGIIKGAHFSDLLRLELLIRYGGTWIDSTVFCSGSNVPSYMLNSELFMFQTLKPGRDGHSSVISNWFISAWSDNKLLSAVRYLLYDYWGNNDELVDYFIFHDFFQMVIEKYPDDWNRVVPFSNSTPHIILLRLFEAFDPDIWDAVRNQTCFHKLSYKFSNAQTELKGTYYDELINKGQQSQIEE